MNWRAIYRPPELVVPIIEAKSKTLIGLVMRAFWATKMPTK